MRGDMLEVLNNYCDKQAVRDLDDQRDADLYLTADVLSQEGYGTITSLLSRLRPVSAGELVAWIEIATLLSNRGELCYNDDFETENLVLGTNS